jgi:glycosidase
MLPFEFHISRYARDKYHFDMALSSTDGRLVLVDLTAARKFAEQMSQINGFPIPASDILALGLIDEIQHILIRQFELNNHISMDSAYHWLDQIIGSTKLKKSLLLFLIDFPPTLVYQGSISPEKYLDKEGIPGLVLEEMLLLHITNLNPAAEKYSELFDESNLNLSIEYRTIVEKIREFLKPTSPTENGNQSETLFDLLLAPVTASPHSLKGQLEYLLQRWGEILGDTFIIYLQRSLDLMRESIIHHEGTGNFGGPAPVLEFMHEEKEIENYSPDKDWMPELVLIAKNSYVWLDQLTKQYQRPIKTLDMIPDEELDHLAHAGITGLWLIGLWERSHASMRIKQMLGNPDAVASAYSLMDYQIAGNLGGWDALNNLRQRAWKRGIRLSADMVPNHMGIDSNWVVDHPDWFLSLPYSPYPNYSFSGVDLSNNERIGIFIEDHYFNKSDAAVVFKRVENGTGDVRYIYHGNDGTSMPWNDTAQLNYLKAEVREAVIQTILQIARNFPIIRFDAAMTLAKKHIQRLWFPEPGAGGAIPSRSEHGLSRAQFHSAMPIEFWREVVDRVAAEVPDTLLLAEAFWLMEGYFVRTLGMHRVYNSAFMHMLQDEDNSKYRTVLKNTLEFDPQILKRYVNFMNNPDEKNAIEQFGDGEKYLGVCTLLSTLPGLPMFGHGQFEGFHEKYGMEYQRAYWDETPNEGLIRAHEWHIFPLLQRRHLFADVKNFILYDFFTSDGQVNEDVFAYSNGTGDGLADGSSQRALIIYHNKYSKTQGWIKTSVTYVNKSNGKMVQKTLGQALGLKAGEHNFTIFRDLENGLEYIRPSWELVSDGIFIVLEAYQHHTYIDFREIEDEGDRWKKVCNDLNGGGYWSIQARYDEMIIQVPIGEDKESSLIKTKKMDRKVQNRTGVNKKKVVAKQKPSKKNNPID